MTRKVKIALIETGLTLQDLADACGVSKPLISMILADKHKGYEHRPKIMQRLKLKAADVWPENGANSKRRAA